MTAARTLCLALLGVVTLASGAGAQTETSIQGSGIVRICEVDGSNLDSAGDNYFRYSPTDAFLSGPPSGFRTRFSCLGLPQQYDVFTTADPKGDERLGFRMVSDVSIAVSVEPQFTEIYGDAQITLPVCLASPVAASRLAPAKVLVRAFARRSLPDDCMDDQGDPEGSGACSGVRARFQGYGSAGFVNAVGNFLTPGTFADMTAPNNKRWTKIVRLLPSSTAIGSQLIGALSATLITRVMHAPSGTAFGDVRVFVEVPEFVEREDCPFSATARAQPDLASVILPRPAWFIAPGDAVPEDFTLAISPPTGPITINQEFDLSVMAATNGAAVTGMTGNIDGQDITGPLSACLQPTAPLSGVAGSIYTCRGLSGGFLAGILGDGAHTLSISVTLSDGRTITDSATWNLRR